MPLYEVTLEQSYYGQQCINRWNYQAPTIPAGSSGAFLAIVAMGAVEDDDTPAFDASTILGQMKAMQSEGALFVQMIAKNIYSNTDFYTYAFPPNTRGSNAAADGLPVVCAWGLTSNRTRADIRRAQKRIAGITENMVDAGGTLTVSGLSAGQALGNLMGNPNTATVESVTTVFNPIVCGREKYHPEGKTTWAYKYYPTEVEQLEHIASVTDFTVKPNVRTQVSRQFGRGA